MVFKWGCELGEIWSPCFAFFSKIRGHLWDQLVSFANTDSHAQEPLPLLCAGKPVKVVWALRPSAPAFAF